MWRGRGLGRSRDARGLLAYWQLGFGKWGRVKEDEVIVHSGVEERELYTLRWRLKEESGVVSKGIIHFHRHNCITVLRPLG